MNRPDPTPERILLTAIVMAMSPKRRARVLDMLGQPAADNILRFRRPEPGPKLNELIKGARFIAGERD